MFCTKEEEETKFTLCVNTFHTNSVEVTICGFLYTVLPLTTHTCGNYFDTIDIGEGVVPLKTHILW